MRYLSRDRNTAARKPEHHRVGRSDLRHPATKLATGIGPVVESHDQSAFTDLAPLHSERAVYSDSV
jgi:hypothetical protein